MDGSGIQTPSPNPATDGSHVAGHVFKLLALLIIVGGLLGGLHIVLKWTSDTAAAVVGKTAEAAERLSDILSSKNSFRQILGPIVSDARFQRLQFCQRNQVCLFRIVRYWGKDKSTRDCVEVYKKESDKTKLASLPIWLNRYCEWDAKGVYEFNFYIDMSDLSKWEYEWDSAKNILTFFPQCEVEASTPAELETPVYTCLASSIGIDKADTKEQLVQSLPQLKMKLAEDQKQFMVAEARAAVAKHYEAMFRLIPNVRIDRFPEIRVVFPSERASNTAIQKKDLKL